MAIIILITLIVLSFQAFQDNVFKKILEKNEGENIMFSPLSIYQILSLLSNGAKENTQKEILKILFPNEEPNEDLINRINSNMKQIISNIESENIQTNNYCLEGAENCKIIFKDVNGIFIKKGVELTNQFTEKCENYNASYFELINAEQINNYCSENTNGKINKVIDQINPNTILMLINAIYFKGIWESKFNERSTEKKDFQNYNKTIIQVDTMYQNYHNHMYYEDEKVQIISLPYISKKLKFKMIIILPNSKKYSSPIDYLNKENITLSEINSKLKQKDSIHLYLPKFNYKFESNLKEILEDMGMKMAFSEYFANFGNLCQNITENIYINKILHKTFIDLNENGTEAAAVTLVDVVGMALPNEEYYMYVNHSFIYMIQSDIIEDIENKYLMPFIGIVNNLGNKVEEENDKEKETEKDKENDKEKENDEGRETDEPEKIKLGNYQNNLKIKFGFILSIIIFLI